MARRSKQFTQKSIAIALMVIGAGLAFWGYHISGAFTSQFTQAFTGSTPDAVVLRYIAGAACIVVGLFLYNRR